MSKKQFVDQLYKLAADVAEQARQNSTEFQQKIEALKALTPYYAAIMRGAKGSEDEADTQGGNFGTWRGRLSIVEGETDGGAETGIPAGGGRGRDPKPAA